MEGSGATCVRSYPILYLASYLECLCTQTGINAHVLHKQRISSWCNRRFKPALLASNSTPMGPDTAIPRWTATLRPLHASFDDVYTGLHQPSIASRRDG